ncbi:RNA-binding S4 domain-containing protein [Erysipelothrix amsterdamensis]|uniref:RNA-binding S4 domain-containing protein n=1 Tax=Erysipelothrix amsterdamensis TaxID=2929157 RepID=A0AAU9VHD8_9FIRM|nr:RNA-binding S4 domain-containing protein [Erysipelothrix sp. A18Y020d]CAH2763941.1 RNA-binding S4 domain-containing protein [Erysipelothrix sp. A18Y020d]
MRLDKYLKVSRIIKRRTVAKELADDDRVFINGKKAKPSSEVSLEDEIEIRFEHRHIKIEVTFLSDKILRSNPPMYELISDQRIDRNVQKN